MIKKHSVILIMAILLAIPIFQSRAAQVEAIRASSEANKTRVVIQLDESVQYRIQYVSESNIHIHLLKTGLGSVRKMTSINDGLVETVTLKEIMGNMTDVNISLTKTANFNILPIGSLDRIVIDIITAELIRKNSGGRDTACRVSTARRRKESQ